MQAESIKGEAAAPLITRDNRTLRDYFVIMLKGMCMGASDIVPGVSGGTMAFILGIYEELINSIRTAGQAEFLQALFKFRIKELLRIVNWPFLLAVGSGILLAILTLSSGLEWLLVNQPIHLWSFFFGLVLASIFTVSKRIDKWTPSLWATLAAGTIGAYILVGLVPAQTPNDWWFLIISGALAICAMILPGISGAFILVLLGKYQYVLEAVNDREILTVALVGIGAVVGLITFAQILGWLFKRYHDIAVAFLTGLMLGSLRKVWPWKGDPIYVLDELGQELVRHGEKVIANQPNVFPDLTVSGAIPSFILALVLAGIGFGAVIILDRLAGQHAK